ncbi:hypothetical protein [Rhizobium sp. CC-YZS058]|uniref:hypothetical protein n=1 Tax=Rhizobium sp. CC-YZS058 TaxID=3042153 RepID=UPI002B058045|nr:hypothetical protein [Rhizobium sp. CC-YZS058]MEA3533683.1 hypothetical protein [Rhizobium sp. CC-YZS058]
MTTIAEDVARSLSYALVEGRTAFITTPVTYANGTSVVVRLDEDGEYFFVSDDGQARLTADMFGAGLTFARLATDVAKRFSVECDMRSFFMLRVEKRQLPAAVAMIANASAISVEKTLAALDKHRAKASHELFVERIKEAFGPAASFDVNVPGTSKSWEVDAAVFQDERLTAIFELVSPAYASVASANMKVGDISAMFDRPRTAIVLSDYERTDASLRRILSSSADVVIAARSEIHDYRLAA